MEHLLHLARTLSSFALVLGSLVFIHEMGHYLAARWARVKVEAFSIGFGPVLKQWVDRHGTEWKLSILPLGGYVRMYGMSPHDRAEIEAQGGHYDRSVAYHEKPVGQRAVIAAAGPVANFLLAIVVFAGLQWALGRPVPLPVVGEVIEHSAADRAGLHRGDEVIAVDGTPTPTFEALRDIVAVSADKDLVLSVRRGDATMTLNAHVLAAPGGHHGRLGVISGKANVVPVGPLGAIAGGVAQTWSLAGETLNGLASVVSSGDGAKELGGPLMIASLSGKVAELGIVSMLKFIAMLSVNLALLNLLPIPVLDGGHLMFYAAEALRGRPVPARAQEYGYRVGIAIIATVFVFVSWNDLVREGVFRWVARLAG